LPSRACIAFVLFATLPFVQVTSQPPTSSSARIQSLFTKSPVDRLIDQLTENAAVFRETLPSITARETIESSSSEGWFKFHAKAVATMRVTRKTPDGPLEESRQITTLNGKPVAPGKHVQLPTNFLGGFGGFGGAFFTPGNRQCFDYTLEPNDLTGTPLELHLTLKTEAASLPNCPLGLARFSATVLVDSESHQLTHIEWNIPEEDATRFHRWPIAFTDFAPIKLGDQTFWLPTTVTGHEVRGKERGDWISHYSDYHRFTATTNILPASP
jgi:hypothetical protein